MTQPQASRRDMLQGLLALAGTGALAACGQQTGQADVPAGTLYPKGDPRNGAASGFYTEELRSFVSQLSDIIVPDTDSPGALKAGVPERLAMVHENWLDRQGKIEWLTKVQEVHDALSADGDRSFAEADAEARLAMVKAMDEKAYDKGGNGADAYRQLKREIVGAYYTTEAGCTEELQWLATPGDWKACVPLKEIGRTWAV
ncbi:gluconate 2-dehydrogenase subunit 3 family protein [Parvularcula sp. ZS-1/3]|uniref:Gluconate 2-dehydrogenase subunit 3 family protein n=1 Tax=Parvularcula mediterranea TaxID=2732508 RepID=A0A7Y3RJZ4_9PROT|nr:gluconate 2-dehydrogenase subunit 3 family protein [Parvularcula mediterranea]NNU15479.1 gluconate 2-dehydrogenase subunit 3 family protein [Parvularcula mediterranea]